ncbi:MAG: hypothetical protein B6245_02400 [Desulfobacteraceae bacterium 4572_88]|nr:MAG: hypothetical protein B6245_02400 [Desulfobacteraceae bacterium 4572_88]
MSACRSQVGFCPYASGQDCDSLFLHDGSLTVPNCEAAPDGVFKNQGNPQPDAYGDSPGRQARFQPAQNSERQ